MFNKPVKTSDAPIVYTSSVSEKKIMKERNTIFLVSGEKIKLHSEMGFEKNIAQYIKTKSLEWFGKEFTYEKIKSSLNVEYKIWDNSRFCDAIYNREISLRDLPKYCGSKISLTFSFDKIIISGKKITLVCKVNTIKIYKKDILESKYMIREEEESIRSSPVESESSDSEISDDEIDFELEEGDFV